MLLVCQKSSSSSHATANRSLKNPEMFPKGLQTKALPRPACKPFQIHGNKFKAIPHNSKCRYGKRGAADAKPKAQIILDAAKVSAASGGNSEPKQGQRSQSARGFCPRSTMRVPQPDIIEHFGNADAMPQPPERCLSRQAGIVRCCPKKRIEKATVYLLFASGDAGKEHRMQHNKNSDANVEIRCEAQATKRGEKRNWKSPRVGYREGKKI
ncbi:MAG: hypothetical protein ACLSCD_01915 [Subdoligranulum sp.]